MMMRLKAKVLVPQHTKPIVYANQVDIALKTHRMALKFIHDQTIRYMNKGAEMKKV